MEGEGASAKSGTQESVERRGTGGGEGAVAGEAGEAEGGAGEEVRGEGTTR